MFVCVILSPSVLSSVPPVSFRHEVTALSVMSVCFHIDRPFCQKQDLDACFRWGKRGIQMVGRKSEEWEGSREKHTKQSYRGKCRVQTQLFLQRAKDYFPWVQEDHPKCVCNIKQPVEGLLLCSFFAWESLKVQQQWSHAASLLVYAFSNSRSSWLKPGL